MRCSDLIPTNKSGSTNANSNRPPGQQNNRGNLPNSQNRRSNLGGNQVCGSFRNQWRRNNLRNRDHNNNHSFNAGQQQQKQQVRGRNNQWSGRNDGGFIAHGPGTGAKKEEVKRAVTDFKPVGIEIKQLGWSWRVIPSLQSTRSRIKSILPLNQTVNPPVPSKPRQVSPGKTSLSPLRIRGRTILTLMLRQTLPS